MRTARPWPLLLRYALRSSRTTPLLVSGSVALLLIGVPAAVSGGLRLTDAVLLIRAGAVLLAVGTAFMLDDPAAATTEVVPVPRWVPRAVRAAIAVVSVTAAWTGVLVLGVRAVAPAERDLLPGPGLALEAAGLLAAVLALAALGLRRTAGTGGGTLAAPGAVLCVLVPVPIPLPTGPQAFAQPLSADWGPSRRLWAVLLCAAAGTLIALIGEPSASAATTKNHRPGRNVT
ncbi:hypothetical protein [Streptomyces sp. NPDC020298]|uniref:hypothetical protein n=1 Tax=unclassified Streptomyces TaxID=2593676 RepID=UPI0033CAE209